VAPVVVPMPVPVAKGSAAPVLPVVPVLPVGAKAP
jgi:hypothetical protein